MTELIKLGSDKEVISSLEIAEITGKEHKNVMRDIRNLLEQLDSENERNFELVNYKDAKGEMRPCYAMTKKGSLCLASGYDANLRMKIINRWEELEMKERATLPTSFAEALQLAADQAREIEEKQKMIEAQKQQLDESKDWYTIKRRAMILGVNWKRYDWRALKRLSILADKPIKKVFDANYGEVNLYHLSIFETYEKTLNLN